MPNTNLPLNFFTIVLNGQPFIRHHIGVFKNLPFEWHWHIIEGVAELNHDTGWSKAAGGTIPTELHRGGLSVDGTTEYVDALKQKFPKNITIYRPPAGKFWDGKCEMINAPLANVPAECLLWQIDVDELWTAWQIIRAHGMFTARPEKSAAFFFCHYFVGPELVITSRNAYGNHSGYEWLRLWRYQAGDRWTTHEPPSLYRGGVNVASLDPFSRADTEKKDLTFQHYAYVLEAQVRFKESYYGYANAVAQWRGLQVVTQFPVWLADHFAWVKDEAIVNTLKFTGIRRLAPDEWLGVNKSAPAPKSKVTGIYRASESTGMVANGETYSIDAIEKMLRPGKMASFVASRWLKLGLADETKYVMRGWHSLAENLQFKLIKLYSALLREPRKDRQYFKDLVHDFRLKRSQGFPIKGSEEIVLGPLKYVPHDGGFFSVFNFVMGELYAGRRVYPLYNVEEFKKHNSYNKHFAYLSPQIENSWFEFFHPIQFEEGDTMHMNTALLKSLPYSTGQLTSPVFKIPAATHSMYKRDDFPDWRLAVHDSVAHRIRLKDSLQREIDKTLTAMPGRKIGVHIRHPSHCVEQGKVFFRDYFSVIDDILKANSGLWSIFIATDNDLALTVFRQRYGNDVFYQKDCIRSSVDDVLDWAYHLMKGKSDDMGFVEGKGFQTHYRLSDNNDGAAGILAGKEAVIDAFTLAGCDELVCTLSNFTLTCSYMNPIQIQHLVSRGI